MELLITVAAGLTLLTFVPGCEAVTSSKCHFLVPGCLLLGANLHPSNVPITRPNNEPSNEPSNQHKKERLHRSIFECPSGLLPQGDGSCQTPRIQTNIFIISPPNKITQDAFVLPKFDSPVNREFSIFLQSSKSKDVVPIVSPAPKLKTQVFILINNQKSGDNQKAFHVPTNQSSEVLKVSYGQGEKISSQHALSLLSTLNKTTVSSHDFRSNTGSQGLTSLSSNVVSPAGDHNSTSIIINDSKLIGKEVKHLQSNQSISESSKFVMGEGFHSSKDFGENILSLTFSEEKQIQRVDVGKNRDNLVPDRKRNDSFDNKNNTIEETYFPPS